MPAILIDGSEYEVAEGRNVLQAALDHKLDLPYFCWHPAMGSVGACRLCAIKHYRDETDKRGRLAMGCMTPAREGTRVSIEDPEARQLRRSVIEWLMINHPHDCPVCDEGGECHLQDMTVMTGHAHRRYRGRKRTYRSQYLGPLIHHEMNRCIQCYRCVRFYDDYSGGHDLGAFASRDRVYFGRVEEGVLESPFAGNLVEVCPTGVFTDKPFRRHYTRKWDLQTAPSICGHCGLGCNTLVGSRYGSVRRVTSRFNGEVNGYWLCDRGRYGYDYLNADERLRQPTRPWGEVVAAIARAAAAGRLAAVGSPRASLETNFALRTLAGDGRFCAGFADRERALLRGFVAAARGGRFHVPSLQEVERADAILVLGADLTNEAPLLDLAVYRARQRQNAGVHVAALSAGRLAEIAASTDHLDPAAAARLAVRAAELVETGTAVGDRAQFPEANTAGRQTERAETGAKERAGTGEGTGERAGEREGEGALAGEIAAALTAVERPLVITGTLHRSEDLLDAAVAIVEALGARRGVPAWLALAVPEPNSIGLALMERPGEMGASELLEAIEAGAVDTLVVAENDLYERFDDPERLTAALRRLDALIVLDHVAGATTAIASHAVPVAAAAESNGTLVNNEGRMQRFYQVERPAAGVAPAWSVARDLALEAAERGGSDSDVAEPGAGDAPGIPKQGAGSGTHGAESTTGGPGDAGDDRGLAQTVGGWRHLEDVTAAIAVAHPELAAATEVAPPAGFRPARQPIPRQTHRVSGRHATNEPDALQRPGRRETPIDRGHDPGDVETPFAFTMEGHTGPVPPALLTRIWAPGWNSNEAINQFQIEVGGPLHGGDPGRRVFAARADATGALEPARREGRGPAPDGPADDGRLLVCAAAEQTAIAGERDDARLLVCAAAEIFASEPLSRRAPALAELAPPAYLRLHPDRAEALGLRAGATFALQLIIGERRRRLQLAIETDATLPPHVALVPFGYPQTRWWQRPLWMRVETGGEVAS
ncbi:MAG TPA: NADH-quinone oxidoreductase subunit NuoG [Acidobacteriota bacterium]